MQSRGKRFVTSVELKPWDEVALDELRRISGLEDVGPALKYAMYQVLTARGVDLEALGVDLDTVCAALGVDFSAFDVEAPV